MKIIFILCALYFMVLHTLCCAQVQPTWISSNDALHYFKNDPKSPPPLHINDIVQQIEVSMYSLAQKKNIPGFAAAIVYKGKVQKTICYGVRSLNDKAPITPQTVFTLGSVSKAITGTFLSTFLTKGTANLNTPLSYYIPHLNNTVRHPHGDYTHTMTLHHVLTHTTGIPRAGFNALIESDKHHDTALRHYFLRARDRFGAPSSKNAPAIYKPGYVYDYHNVGFALTEPVIHNITGQSFDQAITQYFFQPLGMKTASASLPGLLKFKNRAAGHQKNKKGYSTKDYRWGYFQIPSAGGINASLLDMCAFLKAVLGHAPHVLSKQALAQIYTPYTHAPDMWTRNPVNRTRFNGSFYGLGWRILDYHGHKIVFHGGWVRGFINIVMMIPAYDVGIVILQNAETSFPWISAMRFVDAVLGIQGVEWDPKASKKSHAPTAAAPIKPQKPHPQKHHPKRTLPKPLQHMRSQHPVLPQHQKHKPLKKQHKVIHKKRKKA